MTSLTRFGAAALLVVIGVLLELAFNSVAADAVGVGLIAIGLVGAVSLVFYEVGLSEDRQRERETRSQGGGRRLRPRWQRRR